MKYLNLNLLFLVFFFCACNQGGQITLKSLSENSDSLMKELTFDGNILLMKKSDVLTTIHIPKESKYLIGDSIVENYTFIPLETKSSCLIRKIHKLYANSEYILIFDMDNNSVLQFDNEGTFIRKIGQQGRGPNEYIRLWDMSVDTQNEYICLLDLDGRKLLFYDFNGTCIKEESMFYIFTQIEFLGAHRILNTGHAHNANIPSIDLHQLIFTDSEQKPLYRGFPFSSEMRKSFDVSANVPLTKFNNNVYYCNALSLDTIWSIKGSNYYPAYVITHPNDEKDLFTKTELEHMNNELYFEKIRERSGFYGSFSLSEDFLYANVSSQEGEVHYLIYSKKSKNVKYGSIHSPFRTNRLGDYLISTGVDFSYNETSFVKVLQPFTLKNIYDSLDKESNRMLNETDLNMMKNIEIEDNPVLMVVNFKEF